MSPQNLVQLREKEYLQRQETDQLQRLLYEQADLAAAQSLFDRLLLAEGKLSDIGTQRAGEQARSAQASGVILDNTDTDTPHLGPLTTGLKVTVHLRMAQVPTSIAHLLNPGDQPLLTCRVYVHSKPDGITSDYRRLRVTSRVEGYSARAVTTAEIKYHEAEEFDQFPTFFRDRVQRLSELTRATLNVKVEDLDTRRIELHLTYPVWLLAWTTAPFSIQDPKTGKWKDMSRYYGAYVTPNAPQVHDFLAVAKKHHPDGQFRGYQQGADVEAQVKALYDALREEAKLSYVNSIIAFSPEEGTETQRVRLPRESLKRGVANCIDATVLLASLLEAISLNPAIVAVPKHTFIAWETGKDTGEWRYLETTKIATHPFDLACRLGKMQAHGYEALALQKGDESLFRRWSLRQLRAEYGVFPME